MSSLCWLSPALLLLTVAAAARPLGGPSPTAAARAAAAAAAGRDKAYYIFGYGSLLNRESTQKTNCGLSGLAEGSLGGLQSLLELTQDAPGLHHDSLTRLREVLEGCAPKNPRVVRVEGLRRGFYASGKHPPSPPCSLTSSQLQGANCCKEGHWHCFLAFWAAFRHECHTWQIPSKLKYKGGKELVHLVPCSRLLWAHSYSAMARKRFPHWLLSAGGLL
jgi:hypothetical protein